jgi:hypothetical protein
MITMKRRGIETAVAFDRPAVLAELNDKLRHAILPIMGNEVNRFS